MKTQIMRHAAWTVAIVSLFFAMFTLADQHYAEFVISVVLFLVATMIDLRIHQRGKRRDRSALTLVMGFCVVVVAACFSVPAAYADPGARCETVLWGFLGSQRRTICDTPKRASGEWMRERTVWTPAHYVPVTCSGRYYVTCYGGYSVGQSIQSDETYPVNDGNVLADEPGHLAGAGVAA